MKLVISSLIKWILGHFPAHKLHREEGDGHVLPHHKVKLDLRSVRTACQIPDWFGFLRLQDKVI